jgi:glycogen operon protein
MIEKDWQFPEGRFLSYVLGPTEPGGAPLYVVLNAANEAITFTFPTVVAHGQWSLLLETAASPRLGKQFAAGATMQAQPRSILAFAGILAGTP